MMDSNLKQNQPTKPEKLTINKRGQVTIPVEILDFLNLQEDDQLEVTVENGKIIMQPVLSVDKEQAWFWSPEWQDGERDADEDIANHNVKSFKYAEDAISYLRK